MRRKDLLVAIVLVSTPFLMLTTSVYALSTVGTSTEGTATQNLIQRKTCYQSGSYWVFWNNGTNIAFSSSSDGSTWAAPSFLLIPSPANAHTAFNIHCDGTYIHIAEANERAGDSLIYNRATTNSNGTLTLGTWRSVTQQPGFYFWFTNDTDTLTASADDYQLAFQTNSKPQNHTGTIITTVTADDTCWYTVRPFIAQTETCEYAHGSLPSTPTQIGWFLPNRQNQIYLAGAWQLAIGGRITVDGDCPVTPGVLDCMEFRLRVWLVEGTAYENPTLMLNATTGGAVFTDFFSNPTASSTTASDAGPREQYIVIEIFSELRNHPAGQTFEMVLDTSVSYLRSPQESYGVPSVTVDSSGFPAIAYLKAANTLLLSRACAVDGACWAPPITAATGISTNLNPAIHALADRNLYVVFHTTSAALRGVQYTASSGTLGSVETPTTNTITAWSAIAPLDGRVRIAYRSTTDGCGATTPCIKIVTRSAAGAWSTRIILFSGASTLQSAVGISLGAVGGDAYVFWITAVSGNLQYRRVGPDDSLDAITTLNTVTNYRTNTLTVAYSHTVNLISVVWTQNTASPFNVRHNFFTATTIPTDPGTGSCYAGPCLKPEPPSLPTPPRRQLFIPFLNLPVTRELGIALALFLLLGVIVGYKGPSATRPSLRVPQLPEFELERKHFVMIGGLLVAGAGLLLLLFRPILVFPALELPSIRLQMFLANPRLRLLVLMIMIIVNVVLGGLVYLKRRGRRS